MAFLAFALYSYYIKQIPWNFIAAQSGITLQETQVLVVEQVAKSRIRVHKKSSILLDVRYHAPFTHNHS